MGTFHFASKKWYIRSTTTDFNKPMHSFDCKIKETVLFLFLFSTSGFSQIGIGTLSPDESAALDIVSTNTGLLPPRIALTSATNGNPISNPTNGLLIYNTATSGTAPNNVTPGFYFWENSTWNRVLQSNPTITGVTYLRSGESPGITAYGSFFDEQIQLVPANDSSAPMYFRTTDFSQGVSIIDSSKITFEHDGVYNIQFSAQLDKIGSTGTNEFVSIWLRKNGVNVNNTCTDVVINGSQTSADIVPAWNFFVEANANDYYEIIWSSTHVNVAINFVPNRTAPVRPAIPSIILTVNQVH